MNFDQISAAILLGLSSLFGVATVPVDVLGNWAVERPWVQSGGTYEFQATSQSIIDSCAKSPESWLRFPLVVHGVHEISIGSQKIIQWGDPTYNTAKSFFGVPVASCATINSSASVQPGAKMHWKAVSYSRYFARFKQFPELLNSQPSINFFQETMPSLAGGSLVILAIVTTLLFWGRVSNQHAMTVGMALLLPSIYLITSVPETYGISLSMFTLHKTADFSLWVGSIFIMNAFRLSGLFSVKLLRFHISGVILGCAVILFAPTADTLQFGTMLPFPTFLILTIVSVRKSIKQFVNKSLKRHSVLQILSLSSFFVAALNDFVVVAGFFDHGTFMSLGMLAGTVFLALDVSERISETYTERDYLRLNLEKEIETALAKIKSTQSELVQQAKMASLGTLSAGIAHEINNSLNYVNGAIFPLTRIVEQLDEGAQKTKATKLLKAMENGLRVTFDIMKSLRSYSGLNQAALKETSVSELVHSVLTIIKQRIPEKISIVQDIERSAVVTVNAAAISQVIMNLLVNAVDAMPDGGTISIAAKSSAGRVKISVSDSGFGMSQELISRIFEPFYTTKDVGKGTGLGLHICKNEVERHSGVLSVESIVGKGSVFVIDLPADIKSNRFSGQDSVKSQEAA